MRLIIAVAASLAVAAVFVALLIATDTVLSIWERLDEVAPWAVSAYLGLILLLALVTGWFVLRLLLARSRPRPKAPASREELEKRLAGSASRGVDVAGSRHELEELVRRQGEQQLYIAMFGEVSVGKSALINVLLPDARQSSDPRAGTTTEIRYFDWQAPGTVPIRLVDVPGLDDRRGQHLGRAARDEALRAHVVIYVSEGDLTRSQYRALTTLSEFGKPVIVAINKADRYQEEELERIHQRLDEVIPAGTALDVVAVSAGGSEEVVVVSPTGEEQLEARARPPAVQPLVRAIATAVGGQVDVRSKAEHSVLRLAHVKLEQAETRYRRLAADRLVDKYARRAVLGALAAITPGSDLVIQGALASKLMHDLCKLYDTPIRELDLDRFLALAGGRLRRTTAIVLAVSGNALKAFPGVGTVAGGLVHAVAYGMIFDSLGRAAAGALAQGEPLEAERLAERFESELRDNSVARSRQLARLALNQLKKGSDRGGQ